MRRTTVSESNPENLLVDLNHLAGCGEALARETLGSLLAVLAEDVEPGLAHCLAGYPMTSWAALAPEERLPQRLWAALLERGLSEEQAMTVLAVVDDHVRRRFGNGAWARPARIASELAADHGLAGPTLPAATAVPTGRDRAEPVGR